MREVKIMHVKTQASQRKKINFASKNESGSCESIYV
jgi:hypothetical protein